MNFFKLIGVELQKIHRSHIFWILLIPVILLWIPTLVNYDFIMNPATEGLSPEHNFFIQSFMGLAWFMFPASMVVCTVLLVQTERSHGGILKMLSLPVSPAALCAAKFVVLLLLAAVQVVLMTVCYYPCAAIVSHLNDYDLILSPLFVLREAGIFYLSGIPMAAVFWLIAVCIRTPIFSMGIGLASIVPSVLAINTKVWFAYPMCYPFYRIMILMNGLPNGGDAHLDLIPLLPMAIGITIVCLTGACLFFGKSERR